MTSKIINSHSGLVGGSSWTNVSLLNAALSQEALAAIHNRRALAASAVNAKGRRPPRTEIYLDLAAASTLQSAA